MFLPPRLASRAVLGGLCLLSGCAAAHPLGNAGDEARLQCEDAVEAAMQGSDGRVRGAIEFDHGDRSSEEQGQRILIRGRGRFLTDDRRHVAFRYGCTYDEASARTEGVLWHEAAGGAAAAALPVWHADLDRLALDACERETAASVQSLHARAEGVAFDGRDRMLAPGAAGGTVLAGSGHALGGVAPAGLPFRYRCEFDAAGRLERVRVE